MRRDEYKGQMEVPFADIKDVFGDGRRRAVRTDHSRWFAPKIPVPESDIQALMEAPPGHEPVWPPEPNDMLELIDQLGPEDRDLVNALVFERLSLRDAAQRFGVGKSTVARRRDRVFEELRAMVVWFMEHEGEKE